MSRNEIASPVTALPDLLAVQLGANPPTRPRFTPSPACGWSTDPATGPLKPRHTSALLGIENPRVSEGLNTETRGERW